LDDDEQGMQPGQTQQSHSEVRDLLIGHLAASGPRPIPLRRAHSVTRTAGGANSFRTEVPSYEDARRQLAEEVTSLDKNHILERAFPGAPSLWLFLERYLHISGELRANVPAFDQTWAEYEAYLSRATVPYRLDSPLVGLTGDFSRLDLAPGVSVVPITDDWLAQRWQADTFLGPAWLLGFTMRRHLLQVEMDIPRGAENVVSDLLRIADQSIRALRLSAPGTVGICESWCDPLVPVFGGQGPGGFVRRGTPMVGSDMEWRDEPTLLRDMFAALSNGRLGSAAELALRRFEGTYYVQSADDRLVDCWIALEALFLPDQMSELSHLGPLRIALYLEPTLDLRKSLFAELRRSYSARSGIVHGSLAPKLEADLPSLERTTEGVLRRALRKTVAAGHAPTKSELEDLELGGGALVQ
jgi:hypothetical protein